MKLECKDGKGNTVVKECNNEAQIKGMLARGWSEVKTSPANSSKKAKKSTKK